MTFNDLTTSIMQYPDCAVDLPGIFIASTHSYATASSEIISIKIEMKADLKKTVDAKTAKRTLKRIYEAISAGEILPAGSIQVKSIMSPNARRNEPNT